MEKNAIYQEGIGISRKFKSRNNEATERLYDIIKKAIILIQAGTPEEKRDALVFMTKLFKPHIRKVAKKVFRNLTGIVEYSDVLQEAYTMFLVLLERYNSNISAFSYYIGVMLPQHLNRWAEKELDQSSFSISTDMNDFSGADPALKDKNLVYDYLNSYVFTGEYEEFILNRAERQSRSKTGKIVCHRFFLGGSSCSEIARDLGISYHAVYEIIGRIKVELKEFLMTNAFADFEEDHD
jgi:DNA-directed RNA polymerase specialized sigma24 family protein